MDKTKIHTVYKDKSGTRLIGVTTALSILSKPALIHWSWDLGCKGIDYRKFRDDKADIGTLAHEMILYYLRKEKLDTSDYTPNQVSLAENCVLSFMEWQKGKKLEPILLETPLISEKHKYGGSMDCYCKLDGKLTLLDFKTSKGIYDEMLYQLSAYKELLEENGHKVEECKILRIGRNEDEGFEVKTISKTEKYLEMFHHCLSIYNLKKQIKKENK